MITLRGLQAALGGEIVGGRQLLCPGPGHGPRDRSLAVWPSADGSDFTVFSHSGDDFRDCRDFVREQLGWPRWRPGDGRDRRVAPERVRAFDRMVMDAESGPRPRTAEDMQRIERAVRIWDGGVNPRGTAAERYLAARNLVLDDAIAGNVLRFHKACPWRNESTGGTDFIPALIAAFASIDDSSVTAVHRIRLDQPERWPKAERRMLGIVHRAAVKLDNATDTLAIGEGIETCLAARQLGHKPAWALGSVGAIAHFPVLDGIQHLRILGETGQASASAVEMAARRWFRAKRKIQIVTPDVGSDLNDQLMAATA